MSNINENNEIEIINKEISLLQDKFKINEKSLNQFKNGLRRIGRLRLKQWQKTNLSKAKKMQEALKLILKKKINLIKKKSDMLKNALLNIRKRKTLFENGLKKIAKMQNLSQNEFNQIAKMHNLSRRWAWTNYKKKEELKTIKILKKNKLIISLLKSKESISELFNDNNNNEISSI